MHKKIAKKGQKQGSIFGIKISSTSKEQVLNFVNSCLDKKEKFYIVTPNPEIILKAKNDWLLKKSIMRSDLSLPDGIGVAQAVKFLNLPNYDNNLLRPFGLVWQGFYVGLMTIIDKNYLTSELEIIKGRELFLEIIKIADDKGLRVCFVGGEGDEAELTKQKLILQYKNLKIQAYKTPKYGRNGQPFSVEDRRIHKSLLGKIKMFEPDFIFVGMTTPKQEKWIYRNFFRLNAVGAMAIGGTYNYISGSLPVPPKWMEKIGLEWVWRLITEPKRWKRVFMAFPVFPLRIFIYKLFKK